MKSYLNSIIIGTAVVVTAVIFANAFKDRNKSNDTITVTGLGSKDFISDLIVWRGSFETKSLDLREAYASLDRDRESIKKYLISKGLKEENVIFEAVNINKEYDYKYNEHGNRTSTTFTGYRLTQNLQIESNEVDNVENISRKVSELINQGIEFHSNDPQYYYTKLAQLKLEMIAEATKDANTRAKKIAENAGSDIGRLKSANMGVFQIIAQNSSEDFSYGGTFNTLAKRKTATITVRLEYETD